MEYAIQSADVSEEPAASHPTRASFAVRFLLTLAYS
jgi:hypothetical protein